MNCWECKLKIVDNYCDRTRKKTERLLKKMFGLKSVKDALSERKEIILQLEKSAGKKVTDFNMNDVKKEPYLYAKYRTLDKILSIYIDLVSLDKFIIKEYENGYSEGSGN